MKIYSIQLSEFDVGKHSYKKCVLLADIVFPGEIGSPSLPIGIISIVITTTSTAHRRGEVTKKNGKCYKLIEYIFIRNFICIEKYSQIRVDAECEDAVIDIQMFLFAEECHQHRYGLEQKNAATSFYRHDLCKTTNV